MLAFDLFTDASLRVKAGYVDQLRDLDLVASKLLPAIFDLLEVYFGLPKAFKLGMWAVEDYYVDRGSRFHAVITFHLSFCRSV